MGPAQWRDIHLMAQPDMKSSLKAQPISWRAYLSGSPLLLFPLRLALSILRSFSALSVHRLGSSPSLSDSQSIFTVRRSL